MMITAVAKRGESVQAACARLLMVAETGVEKFELAVLHKIYYHGIDRDHIFTYLAEILESEGHPVPRTRKRLIPIGDPNEKQNLTDTQRAAISEARDGYLAAYCGLWKRFGDGETRPTFTKRTMTSLVSRGFLQWDETSGDYGGYRLTPMGDEVCKP